MKKITCFSLNLKSLLTLYFLVEYLQENCYGAPHYLGKHSNDNFRERLFAQK